MTAPSSCLKFAILGVVALAAPAAQLKLLIGMALPLPEIIEFAFAYAQGRNKKRRLRDFTLSLADDVSKILGNDKNVEAVILLAERCIGNFGLSEVEFARLGLDAGDAADAVLARLDKRPKDPSDPERPRLMQERRDRKEIEDQTRRVLVHFYERVCAHPEFLQDLLPHVYRALYKTIREGQDAIQEELRKLQAKAEKPSFGVGMPTVRSEFYELRCPPSIQDYDTVAGWATSFFDEGEVVDEDADRKAFLRNPYSMVVLANYLGDIVGYIDIYHLPDAVLDAVLWDKTGEVEIDPAECLDYEQAQACTRAYIATLMVRHHAGMSTRQRSRALIYGMMEFILKHQFHGTDHFEIWSIGSRSDGEETLKELKFEYDHMVVVKPGGEPKPAFRRRFSKDELIAEQEEFFSENDLRNVVLNISEHP